MNINANETVVETNFDLLFNEQTNLETSNLAPMVADAIHWYVNQITPNDITMVAAGRNYPFWEGVRFSYHPRRMLFDQVYEIEIGNEKPLSAWWLWGFWRGQG